MSFSCKPYLEDVIILHTQVPWAIHRAYDWIVRLMHNVLVLDGAGGRGFAEVAGDRKRQHVFGLVQGVECHVV